MKNKCASYEDGCEEWAGCPCVYYKEIKKEECGICMWFDGDFRDDERFCDEKEQDVSHHNWCPKYREDAYKKELLEQLKKGNEE